MTAHVAQAPGLYADTASWVGGVVPVDGDTFTSAFDLVVTGTHTIGDSPSPAAAVATFTNGGKLRFSGGGELIVKGNVVMGAGAEADVKFGTLSFDNSAQPDEQYCITGGYEAGIINGSGTSEAERGAIRSVGTGIPAQLLGSRYDLNYVNLTKLGNAAGDVLAIDCAGNAAGDYMKIKQCKFDQCGRIAQEFTPGAGYVIELENNTHTNTVAATPLQTNGGDGYIKGCVFDKIVNLYNAGGIDVTDDNFFLGGISRAGADPKSQARNFIQVDGVACDPHGGIQADNYYFLKSGGHLFSGLSAGAEYDDDIFEAANTDPLAVENDLLPAASGYDGTVKAKRCIVLPNSEDPTLSSGCLGSFLGNSTSKLEKEHCTEYVGRAGAGVAGGGTNIGESNNGAEDMIHVCKSNLAWSDVPNGGCLVNDIGGATVPNVVNADGCTNNGGWNLATGVGGVYGLNLPAGSTGVYNANGVIADPQFVDPYRNLKTWDLSLGGPGTQDHAVAQMAKRNDVDFDARYARAELMAYVRAGIAPTNPAYAGAAADGGDIGAVACVLNTFVYSHTRRLRLRRAA